MKKAELEEQNTSLRRQIAELQSRNEKLFKDFSNIKDEYERYKSEKEDEIYCLKNSRIYKIGGLISELINEKIQDHDDDYSAHCNLARKY